MEIEHEELIKENEQFRELLQDACMVYHSLFSKFDNDHKEGIALHKRTRKALNKRLEIARLEAKKA